jgi:hypothetical protein
MNINIQDFIAKAGLNEPFYPGKRVVKPFVQPGDYKSHCIVYDWRDEAKIRIEIRAGLSGKILEPSELAKYPVSLQTSTFFEIDVASGTLKRIEEDEDSKGSRSGESGSRAPLKKRALSSMSFSSAAEGIVASQGYISRMVVMGMEIASDAYDKVSQTLFAQVSHAKIIATDLVAAAGKMITKYTPPAFLKPKGNENSIYTYDREKNEAMFAGTMPS